MATAPKEWSPLLLQFHPSALLWLNRLSAGLAARRGCTSEKATGWVVALRLPIGLVGGLGELGVAR